jgi:hypothetical protein
VHGTTWVLMIAFLAAFLGGGGGDSSASLLPTLYKFTIQQHSVMSRSNSVGRPIRVRVGRSGIKIWFPTETNFLFSPVLRRILGSIEYPIQLIGFPVQQELGKLSLYSDYRRLDERGIGAQFSTGKVIFLSFIASRPSLRPSSLQFSWYYWLFSQG